MPDGMTRAAAATPWTQTAGGRAVDLLHPRAEQIALDDIAWHLAGIRRFNAATRCGWTVAAHSRLVERIIADRWPHVPALRLAALLHDAHEAYLGDITSPVKLALAQVDAGAALTLRTLEHGLQRAIHQALGLDRILPFEWREAIHEADLRALDAERITFMQPQPRAWAPLPPAPPGTRLDTSLDQEREAVTFAAVAQRLQRQVAA